MDKGLIASLNQLGGDDRRLLVDTEPTKLSTMSEEELLDLHKVIRKRRNKHRSVYRRKGAKKAKKAGGRGKGKQQNQRNADRLELFEEALDRVSRALADAAQQSAAELRDLRLRLAGAPKRQAREARAEGGVTPAQPAKKAAPRKRASSSGATTRTNSRKTATARKTTAANRASNARRQAKRDAR